MSKRRGLGRSLDALIGSKKLASEAQDNQENTSAHSPCQLPVEYLQGGRYQPRTNFDDAALHELSSSIRQQGIIQPIVVRRVEDNRYEILAGERRWRAAKLADLSEVPVIIRKVDDEAAMAIALIENIQREDLNPIEEARALKRLIEEFQLTHQQISDAVGKSRTTVTNLLRLMNLHPQVQKLLENGDIEMGHARALLAIEIDRQLEIAKQVIEKQLTVRQVEQLIKQDNAPRQSKTAEPSPTYQHYQQQLSQRFATKVNIKANPKGKGQVVIHFNDQAELQKLLTSFNVK